MGRIRASRAVTDDRSGVPPENPAEEQSVRSGMNAGIIAAGVLWEKTNLTAVPAEKKREKQKTQKKQLTIIGGCIMINVNTCSNGGQHEQR